MNRVLSAAVGTVSALVLSAGGASVALAAGPTDDPTAAAAELCTNLNELKADIAKLRALDPANATKDQIQEAHSDVQDDWKDVAESTATWKASHKDAVKTAAENMKTAYEALPGDTTGRETVAALQQHTEKLDTAVTEARSGLNCG
ncbi:hypothetical protein ACTVZO_34010 [Streptomyces sp. IBSNAI002]|uniref:hypothetical protein n=1 Tax=Streptomyces sp. IBSNAI002 TaxID=3457500 RepID=UPI003FCF63AB